MEMSTEIFPQIINEKIQENEESFDEILAKLPHSDLTVLQNFHYIANKDTLFHSYVLGMGSLATLKVS